ncbi:protein D3 [Helicoverpa armigera]|uniref:protein D3 n=1 Tax=Helicoverpa armigera TaxID=29058 RepID=UPI003083A33C
MARLCCVVLIICVNSFVVSRVSGTVAQSFFHNDIVPDVLSVSPTGYMTVVYPDGVEVKEGNVLTPSQVKDIPTVSWDITLGRMYTVVMIDPDAPSRLEPTDREYLHWLMVNVPGDNLKYADTIAEYVGAGPPQDTGLHRYVFLVYQQPFRAVFNETVLSNRSSANRTSFSVSDFAEKYHLGDPVAGNFFQAEYDDYVPVLQEQLRSAQASLGSNMALCICFLMCFLRLMK